MTLRDLIDGLDIEAVEGPLDLPIHAVRDDSRAVGAGDLFVAVVGQTTDGHGFLEEVARRGAAAAVVDRPAPEFRGTRIRVRSTRRALARLAAASAGHPDRSLALIAITGTNGKTTTTFLVESMLRAAGHHAGRIGTVGARYAAAAAGGRPAGTVGEAAVLTTPTPLELHALLARMAAVGTTHVVMEASSHALALDRLHGIEFRVGAFTNLTQDHLDFHAGMEDYFAAKARLFRDGLGARGVGVCLVDGPYGARMADTILGARLLVSAEGDGAEVYPTRAECTLEGIRGELASPLGPIAIDSPLIGRYNLANIAVAAGVGIALGLPGAAIAEGVRTLAGVPGRIERVPSGRGISVVVDYAHTHDALENVLGALRPLTRGRILCVFGCGGDRDRAKRPRMGRSVGERADITIVTSDNPRTEDPRAIVDMILGGLEGLGLERLRRDDLGAARRGLYVEVDRRTAIQAAIVGARPGDVVLIAGKGHEDYQIVGHTKHPFDDRQVAAEALGERAKEAS